LGFCLRRDCACLAGCLRRWPFLVWLPAALAFP
jgi:hypothetical protein